MYLSRTALKHVDLTEKLQKEKFQALVQDWNKKAQDVKEEEAKRKAREAEEVQKAGKRLEEIQRRRKEIREKMEEIQKRLDEEERIERLLEEEGGDGSDHWHDSARGRQRQLSSSKLQWLEAGGSATRKGCAKQSGRRGDGDGDEVEEDMGGKGEGDGDGESKETADEGWHKRAVPWAPEYRSFSHQRGTGSSAKSGQRPT